MLCVEKECKASPNIYPPFKTKPQLLPLGKKKEFSAERKVINGETIAIY